MAHHPITLAFWAQAQGGCAVSTAGQAAPHSGGCSAPGEVRLRRPAPSGSLSPPRCRDSSPWRPPTRGGDRQPCVAQELGPRRGAVPRRSALQLQSNPATLRSRLSLTGRARSSRDIQRRSCALVEAHCRRTTLSNPVTPRSCALVGARCRAEAHTLSNPVTPRSWTLVGAQCRAEAHCV